MKIEKCYSSDKENFLVAVYLPNLRIQWIETLSGSEYFSNYGVKRFSCQVRISVSTTDAGVSVLEDVRNSIKNPNCVVFSYALIK